MRLSTILRKLHLTLHQPVSPAPLVTVRILLGALLLVSTLRFLILGWVEDHYVRPAIHFSYFGFEWLPRVGETSLYVIHFLMLAASLLVMLGWYYRLGAISLFLLFTYTELYDLTYYLNHYYFVSLACLLLCFVPAQVQLSLDGLQSPEIVRTRVPAWTVWIFKAQIGLVYFYAGIAKINYDWLIEALPLRIWLPPNEHLPLIGFLFTLSWTPWIFSWMGMLFDLTIPLWLLIPKTRPWAYGAVIGFHALTGLLFQIGVFPLVMMGGALIFFSREWHTRLHAIISKNIRMPIGETSKSQLYGNVTSFIITIFIVVFFIFQLVFPWRYVLYPGNRFWTEEGYRFGWRVMLMEKAATATFFVTDTCTGKEGVVTNSDFLNDHQEKQMAMQPDMILQFARHLHQHYQRLGLCNPEVRAEVYVTLNGAPGKLYFDPCLNLARLEDSWSPKTWLYAHR